MFIFYITSYAMLCKFKSLLICYFLPSFTHPHVRARLEKHMGSNLVRLTDKTFMTELEERIRAVNEENLNKRISSRVVSPIYRNILKLNHS